MKIPHPFPGTWFPSIGDAASSNVDGDASRISKNPGVTLKKPGFFESHGLTRLSKAVERMKPEKNAGARPRVKLSPTPDTTGLVASLVVTSAAVGTGVLPRKPDEGFHEKMNQTDLEFARFLENKNTFFHGTTEDVVDEMRANGIDPDAKPKSTIEKLMEFRDPQVARSNANLRNYALAVPISNRQANALAAKEKGSIFFTQMKQKTARTNDGMTAVDYAYMAAAFNSKAPDTGQADPAAAAPGIVEKATKPKILRAYLPDWKFNLMEDPSSMPTTPAIQVREPIPSGFVTESKSAPPRINSATEAFRAEYNNSPLRGNFNGNAVATRLDPRQAAELKRHMQSPSVTDFHGQANNFVDPPAEPR